MKHIIGAFVAVLIFSSGVDAKTIQLLAKDCHNATEAEIPRNDPDWKPSYWRAAEICLLHGPDGQTPVRLLGLPNNQNANAPVVIGEHPEFLPAILLDSHGRRIGYVAGGLPTNFPGEAQLFFSDWRDGFPWHIRVRMVNDAVNGTHDDPSLDWDPNAQRYDAFIALTTQDCISLSNVNFHVPKEIYWPWIYRKYTDTCMVGDPDNNVVFDILTFRADKAKTAGFFRHNFTDLSPPLPIILGEHRLPIGQINHPFPSGDSGRTQIVFSDWRHNFPWRIHVFGQGNAHYPAFDDPPLIWDPVGKRYMAATQATRHASSVPAIGHFPAPDPTLPLTVGPKRG